MKFFVPGFCAGKAALALFATTLALLSGSTARAHEGDHWPIAGKSLKMAYSQNGLGTRFSFSSSSDVNINPISIAQDPTTSRSTLLVRGTGASAGTTNLIELDKARWTRIGSAAKPKGWMYHGDAYYTKGITKIMIKSGKSNGSLQIQAKGYYWPFQITGSQDSVDIVLTIGAFAFCADFDSTVAPFKKNDVGVVEAAQGAAPSDCPAVCGNGIVESGEQCDDGNFVNNDTCTNECAGCNPADVQYTSTFDGIQALIFDNPSYGCSNDLCHGSTASGGLDLRAGNSYASLVNHDSEIRPGTLRVSPGDQDLSMLYLKIAKRTLGTDAPGNSMPAGATTMVTADHLEAIRKWIRGGAPQDGVVTGTAALLGSCLPEATPLNIPQPPVPDPSVGTQFPMPGYTLYHGTEIEGCLASYYDVSTTVPPSMIVDCPNVFPGTNESGPNAGKCFSFNKNDLYQDAQTHHSIVHIYKGASNWNDPGWGGWSCYEGPTAGATCDPSVTNSCGAGGVCGSHFHPGVACNPTLSETWGPTDFSVPLKAPQFSGSQESTAHSDYPDGVYGVLPLKGLIVWNSHAFNLTTQDTDMNAWVNMGYASNRQWPAQGLFDSDYIFTQHVLPFQQQEYCSTFTFPDNTHLFQLTSHTHRHGIRWRYFAPPQAPCPNGGAGTTNPLCVPDDNNHLFQNYASYDYSDPLTLNFNPPIVFSGSVPNRTIKFCSLYDNGMINPDTVKTRSGSPQTTGGLIFGGPCALQHTYCNGGVNKGNPCDGLDANCPGSVCDACELLGGVTTEDEMFIALGTYYVP